MIVFSAVLLLLISGSFVNIPGTHTAAHAEEIEKNIIRFSGSSRYDTALEISRNNWSEAAHVVLSRGDAYPDALAGAVLAHSAVANGPLLLTGSGSLPNGVLEEIKRLNAAAVFILGGTGAISQAVEDTLAKNGLDIIRVNGIDRYDTAANIAMLSAEYSTEAFIFSGENFADGLSISSYAAAKGIPLLITEKNSLPAATLNALEKIGVTNITLIGGENAISPAVYDTLLRSGYQVERLSGMNRYETNANILNRFDFNLDTVFITTGLTFPDALTGSVLAAQNHNPVVLVPKSSSTITGTPTASYLEQNRVDVRDFFILGGYHAVNYSTEFYIQHGKMNPRISLQFWDGYGVKSAYEKMLAYVPDTLTDHIQILVPNFAGELQANGSFTYSFPSATIPQYLVSLGKSKGAKVVPMVLADGDIADAMLLDATKRTAFADSAVQLVLETNADGILIDLEDLANHTGAALTSLMKDIYERLSPKGKLVMISVMSKTSRTAEPWYKEYNYQDLAKYADYIQIMSYDFSYSTSAPGPIAPLDWVNRVMAYAVTEIPSEKILMGVPYYGRAWKKSGNAWVSKSMGWAVATQTAARYGAAINRTTNPADAVGIPTFQYVDSAGAHWTVYYDDRKSWEGKLNLVDHYNLGGVGGWAMSWINEVSSSELYPLLKMKV